MDTLLQILTSPQDDGEKNAREHSIALKYDFHDPAFYNNPYKQSATFDTWWLGAIDYR